MLPRSLQRMGFAIVLAVACASTAAAFPGAGAGVGGGGMSMGGVSVSGVGLGGAAPNGNVVGGLGPVFAMPQRFHDLNVVGQVGVKQSSLPASATVVRLSLDGREIPMRLNTELHSAEVQFDPNANYARDLYRSILTKRVEVVGQQELREEIARAAAESRPLEIEGYVFDRTSPYFVVKSVKSE